MKKMHGIAPAAAIAVALLALGGCATKGDIELLRTEIASLRSAQQVDRRQGHQRAGDRAERRGRRGSGRGFGQCGQPEGRPDLPRRPAQVRLAGGVSGPPHRHPGTAGKPGMRRPGLFSSVGFGPC